MSANRKNQQFLEGQFLYYSSCLYPATNNVLFYLKVLFVMSRSSFCGGYCDVAGVEQFLYQSRDLQLVKSRIPTHVQKNAEMSDISKHCRYSS